MDTLNALTEYGLYKIQLKPDHRHRFILISSEASHTAHHAPAHTAHNTTNGQHTINSTHHNTHDTKTSHHIISNGHNTTQISHQTTQDGHHTVNKTHKIVHPDGTHTTQNEKHTMQPDGKYKIHNETHTTQPDGTHTIHHEKKIMQPDGTHTIHHEKHTIQNGKTTIQNGHVIINNANSNTQHGNAIINNANSNTQHGNGMINNSNNNIQHGNISTYDENNTLQYENHQRQNQIQEPSEISSNEYKLDPQPKWGGPQKQSANVPKGQWRLNSAVTFLTVGFIKTRKRFSGKESSTALFEMFCWCADNKDKAFFRRLFDYTDWKILNINKIGIYDMVETSIVSSVVVEKFAYAMNLLLETSKYTRLSTESIKRLEKMKASLSTLG